LPKGKKKTEDKEIKPVGYFLIRENNLEKAVGAKADQKIPKVGGIQFYLLSTTEETALKNFLSRGSSSIREVR